MFAWRPVLLFPAWVRGLLRARVRRAVARAALGVAAVGMGMGTGTAMAGGDGGGTVALTFDDLPGLSILPDQGYVDGFNADLLAGLRRHRIRATGFVVEGKLDELVRAMRDPAYATREDYAGSDGIEWLERWATALNKPLDWDKFREMPHDIAVDYARVDSDASGGGG